MPCTSLAHSLLLPEMRLLDALYTRGSGVIELHVEKASELEVCPRCATPSRSVYDRRWVRLKDTPVRAQRVLLKVRKRRFSCAPCRKPFTEPLPGVKKGGRTTERFRKTILWACERFSSLKDVLTTYRCSPGFLYKNLYAELARSQRAHQYQAWPKTIGIDEHAFKRNKVLGCTEFASMIVDYKGKRIIDVVEGKTTAALVGALEYLPGRENVRNVVIDMCDPFKNFAREFFVNAKLVADKFHVLRLLNPSINRRRKEITGDKRSLRVRKLLLRNGKKLTPLERFVLRKWLKQHPELNEVYHFKEALHGFYRIKGTKRASRALTAITDRMAESKLPEITTLRRTLIKWRAEILAYFETRLTNARTEGFNNKAKVVKRRAYGYRNFRNYRLRLLHACR